MNSDESLKDEAIARLPEWMQRADLVVKTSRYEYDWPKVGGLIRDRRKKARISLRKLARLMHVSPAHLSDMERGLKSWPMHRLDDATEVLGYVERANKNVAMQKKIKKIREDV